MIKGKLAGKKPHKTKALNSENLHMMQLCEKSRKDCVMAYALV